MDCVLPDESFCSGVGLIVGKAKVETLKTPFYEAVLLYMCIPIIFIGIISNALVLWIWLSVKIQFHESVYLFRALTVADILYVASYIFARLHKFRSDHIRIFFIALCYGNRYISNYITLILAIVRFIKLFFPLHVSKMLSYFRLSLSLTLISCFVLSLTTYTFAFQFFYGKDYGRFYNYLVSKVILTVMPVLAQNFIMLIVVLKLRRFSKTFVSFDVKILQLPQQGQTMSRQKKKIQPAQKLGILSLMQTGLDHTETVCNARPRNPWIPVDTEEAAQSDHAAEGQLKTKQESVVFEAGLEIIQKRDQPSEEKPQNSKQGLLIDGPESSVCDDRSGTLQPMSFSSKGQIDINRRIIYVVLAMCLSTFVSEVFCAVVKFMFYKTDVFDTPLASYVCNVINLISHSINLVFYLFISSFRQALLTKTRRLLDSYSSTSVKTKATHPTTRVSEGRSLNSITDSRLAERSDDMTDSKLNVCSSSKFR